MTYRRKSEAERIADMKVELENRKNSLERLVMIRKLREWTKDEQELADAHVVYIKKYAPIVKNFYRPAMVIAE